MYGVEIETIEYEDDNIGPTVLNNYYFDNSGEIAGGLPYTRLNDTLVFWYKYVAAATDDSAGVYVDLRNNENNVGGMFLKVGAASSYTKVAIPLEAFSEPTNLRLTFLSSFSDNGPVMVAGSRLTIDEVQLASTPLNTGLKGIFNKSASIGLYPNPASNVAVIQTNNKAAISYSLNDITGKIVLTGTGNEMNLSSLKNGIYFVTVKSGTEVIAIKKLVKE
jgi:hypothetical protein